MKYGQFCPISKASEIIGERWSILIIRELLMGGRRFSELQRGLSQISPALLTSRLKGLEERGLVEKRKLDGRKSYGYFPTEACEQLRPIVFALGEWGLNWARINLMDDEYDPALLMLYLERSVDPRELPNDSTVIRFEFTDLGKQRTWWLVVEGDAVDICTEDPGKEIDVYVTTTLRTMTDVWMGDRSYRGAKRSGQFAIQGPRALTRNISTWLRPSIFAASDRAPLRRARPSARA
jgi:DNA-binding HxlR family transcriptional regulator